MNTGDKNKVLECLARLLDDAPDFGEVGLTCRIHAGGLVHLDRLRAESIKLEPSGCQA